SVPRLLSQTAWLIPIAVSGTVASPAFAFTLTVTGAGSACAATILAAVSRPAARVRAEARASGGRRVVAMAHLCVRFLGALPEIKLTTNRACPSTVNGLAGTPGPGGQHREVLVRQGVPGCQEILRR